MRRNILVIGSLSVLLLYRPVRLRAYGPLTHVVVAFRFRSDVLNKIQLRYGPLSAGEKSTVISALMAGALLQDVGYADTNLARLSDLLHYDGTGSFVDQFLVESLRAHQPPEVIAFALGALSHYAADREGHYWATNRTSARLLGVTREVGYELAYEDNQDCHTCIEEAFDSMVLSDLAVPELAQLLASLNGLDHFVNDRESLRFVIAPALAAVIKTVYGLEARALLAAPSATPMEVELSNAYAALLDHIAFALQQAHNLYGKCFPLNKVTFWPKLLCRVVHLAFVRCGGLGHRVRHSPEISAWFQDSLRRSSELYKRYIDQMRYPLDSEPSMWPPWARPPQVNLDTNLIAARGEYFLADCVVNWIRANGKPEVQFSREFELGGSREDFYLHPVAAQQISGLGADLAQLQHREQGFDAVTAPGRSAPLPLPKLLPTFEAMPSPACTRAKLTFLRLGHEPEIGIDHGLVCMSQGSSLLAVWVATLASTGRADRSALDRFYLSTRYAYSHKQASSAARFVTLCSAARKRRQAR